MRDALMLLAALAACMAGMGWFALSLDTHWEQVRGKAPRPAAMARQLRWLGAVALAIALVLCLVADSASIAVLVWLMAIAAAALAVALTLTWRARVLAVLVFWAGA
ncbi:DUF3325 family protein [Pseudoduganella albidiflava]|uniref:DUF3325 family protein n=1 Tax=Pseudoduganella albidiflava TaxID=321983 RepID=A0A411WY77_9BURK|nr:DUF3325 family protein [Pseudoduganella albidiflava]QBI01646.1 DUF3325 family protein [Pseudoduganella albidiflava]GGY33935.1 hypothetical protein GCM10007387_14810 [Pseudoduganella albidiflava]